MKKLITTIFIIIAAQALFGQKKSYNVGILLDKQNSELAPLLEQLKTEITSVVGEDATIVFPENGLLANNFDLEKAKKNYENLISGDIDIILAFGIVNNQIINTP